MTIDSMRLGNQQPVPIRGPQDQIQRSDNEPGNPDKGVGFQEALNEALDHISRLSGHADQEIQGLITGRSQNPHDAMIAMEKADVAFQLMNAVRTKIVRAYEEIMRTPV